MPNSYTIHTGNGVQTNFSVPFPYLSRSHVSVKVDGSTVSFTWVNDSTVQVSPAPANLSKVEVRRVTPTTPLVTYNDGSTLLGRHLNQSNKQTTYLAEEAKELTDANISLTAADTYDAESKRIVNVADPVDNNDAANKQYVVSQTASAVAAAAASAGDAASSAAAAAQSALDATTNGAAQVALATAQKDAAVVAKDAAVDAKVDAEDAAIAAIAAAANLPNATTGGANKWLKINGTATGWVYRTNAEVLSDIGAQAALGYTAANDALVAKLAASQTFTAGQTPFTGTLTNAATIAWDASVNGQSVEATPTAARTFGAPTNIVNRRFYALEITNSGGAWAHAFNAKFIFDTNQGTPGSFPAGAKLQLTFKGDSSGNLREWGRTLVAS